MATTRISVNAKAIQANQLVKNLPVGEHTPTIIVTYEDGEQLWTNHVEILGPSRICYSPEKEPLSGARVWIETESDVVASA